MTAALGDTNAIGRADRHPDRRIRSEQGFAAIWIVAILPVVIGLFAVGLGLWSGYATRQHLSQLAEAAARSGANAIDETAFNETGEVIIDEELAIQFATETLAIQPDRDRLTDGSISVVDNRVLVTVTGNFALLGVVVDQIEVDATAEPRLAAADDPPPDDPTAGPPTTPADAAPTSP